MLKYNPSHMEHLLEPIFTATLDALTRGGVWAVFLLMIIESACIPAPSELIMLWAGYYVWQAEGDNGVLALVTSTTFFQVVAAGVVGNLIGSLIAWAVGAYGGRTFIERHGKWLHISSTHLAWADRWFERRGAGTVFFTRNMPIIRTFISLPAGVARMPLARFSAYTFAGCIPWVTGLAVIGVYMGPNWERARDVLHYGDYFVVVAVAVGGLWLLARRYRRRNPAGGTVT